MIMKRSAIATLATSLLLLTPTMASAHPGHVGNGFVAGFAHPLSGIDHLLVMFGVGIWAVQLKRVSRWRLPTIFLTMMCVGAAIAMLRVPLPLVDGGVLASVLIMGLVVLFALQLRAAAAASLAGAFALLHGYVHLAEMPPDAATLNYAAGFLLASAWLIAAGAALASAFMRIRRPEWLRACGGAITAAALVLLALA
jgi:urease accessory protein